MAIVAAAPPLDRSPQGERAKGTGVSRYTQIKLDRLAREFPDLHERVKSGELSVNAAAIQAGIVKPTSTVPHDVEGAIRALRRHFSPDELDRIAAALVDHRKGSA